MGFFFSDLCIISLNSNRDDILLQIIQGGHRGAGPVKNFLAPFLLVCWDIGGFSMGLGVVNT